MVPVSEDLVCSSYYWLKCSIEPISAYKFTYDGQVGVSLNPDGNTTNVLITIDWLRLLPPLFPNPPSIGYDFTYYLNEAGFKIRSFDVNPHTPPGVIAGAVVGSVLAAACIIAVFCWIRKLQQRQRHKERTANFSRTPSSRGKARTGTVSGMEFAPQISQPYSLPSPPVDDAWEKDPPRKRNAPMAPRLIEKLCLQCHKAQCVENSVFCGTDCIITSRKGSPKLMDLPAGHYMFRTSKCAPH